MIKKVLITLTAALLFSACHQTIDISLPKVSNKRVLFVGEHHDNYAHHLNQKSIIQQLHRQGKKIAIGMEMFQRPFQAVLDDYIAGKIDEKTMLKKSEYFLRWGYDYRLYRPIMLYAKENHIPLIALNLKREITKKVSKSGIGSLNDVEKKRIPKELELDNEAYKERILEVLNDPKHLAAMPAKYRPNITYIYQAQVLWDETMAQSIASYLKSHPDTIMIVLAGNGHLEYYSGIPNRLTRRLDIPIHVILQDEKEQPNRADQYLFPKTLQMQATPKLGVQLDRKALKVTSVFKGSLAEKLGVKREDTILQVDNMPVRTLADLRLALYLYHDKIELIVKRANKKVLLK